MQRPDGFSDESLTESEKRGLERAGNFMTSGAAYALEHGTRPSTIGHVLSSSPMALLAWYVGMLNTLPSLKQLYLTESLRCGEKFLDWADEPLPSKTILEFVSLYWLTETFPRAIYPYREVRTHFVCLQSQD